MIKPENVTDEYVAGFYQEECTAGCALLLSASAASFIVAAQTEISPGADITLGAVGGIFVMSSIAYARKAMTYRRRAYEIVATAGEPVDWALPKPRQEL